MNWRDLETNYARSLVRYLAIQIERHDQRCGICYLVDECEKRKAMRWYRTQTKRKEKRT
jgi:hypothetical protein